MPPATADLRRFLVDAFSDEDLKALCFDYFRDVYDDFTTGMTKTQMIQIVIERCDRRDALAGLYAALRIERREQYEKRFGAVAPAAAANAPVPAETAAVVRDPRQVFISHAARQDADFAHRLAADLAIAGWRPWIAPDSIQPGEKWVEAIGRGLDSSGVFVVALTPAAIASRWVKTETNAAVELENRGEVQFIPLDVAACSVPILWSGYQRVSFRGRYGDGLRMLLARLGWETGRQVDTVSGQEAAKPAAQAISVPAGVRSAPKRGPIDFDWVTIPAGEFLMGSDKAKDKQAFDDETPQHTLHLPEYRIARVPVTVAQFAAFMAANPGYRTTAEVQGSAWSYTGVGVGGCQRRRLGAPARAGERRQSETGSSRHLRVVARRSCILQVGRRAAAVRGGVGEGRARHRWPHLAVGRSGAEQRTVQLQHDRGRHDAGGPLS